MELLSFHSFLLFTLLHTVSTYADSTALPGTITRTTKQQVLVTLPSDSPSTTHPFLISPDGKYAAYFLRRASATAAGGFGNDFCYIQVIDAGTAESVWESDCAPVSTANACSLVFSDSGLEIFDGSGSVWSTDAQSDDALQVLELVDEGDMRIRDNGGELAWKASEEPRQNQRCGEPGSPGLTMAMPPFAQPIGGKSGQMPFGQHQPGQSGQSGQSGQTGMGPEVGNGVPSGAVDEDGVGDRFGLSRQLPLVDSTPYDSGSHKGLQVWVGIEGALLFCLTIFGGFFI